jgi:D-lactate dehydrogenase
MSEALRNMSAGAPTAAGNRQALLDRFRQIVGRAHVADTEKATRRYRTGFRFGSGKALAVVRPGSLVEQWRVLQACVRANVIVIPQASNTGLTGGSTPDGDDYDRDIVIISTTRMKKVYVIRDGRQVICLPGATLDQLEQTLLPLGREPHSVIGSSCIGASVFGGVCNNSGGALVNRGPAYTELAVFARVDRDARLSLVNHLGVELGQAPEDILGKLDRGAFTEDQIHDAVGAASDASYAAHVRDVDAHTPARFNADASRLHEAAGSGGKLMVFALRLDTFPIEKGAAVFYIGTNDTQELADIRRHVLTTFEHLPIAGEYMHRDAFDVAAQYGKDTIFFIERFGTRRMPAFFRFKARCDELCRTLGLLPEHFPDRALQALTRRLPGQVPERLQQYRDRFEHHLLLKVSAGSIEETRAFLARYLANRTGEFIQCSADEGRKAFLIRFAAAGAAVRYRAVHGKTVEDIVALDIALRRNDNDWFERLPAELDEKISLKLYYGHFLCHVLHQDYVVKKGQDCLALEHRMWALLDRRGAEYPAEHNVGHLYPAKPALRAFYESLDPCNCFNAGIGQMSKFANYRGQSS